MLLCDIHGDSSRAVKDCGESSVMVPVIPGTYSALLGTITATSIAMSLPRGILNSQSRGVLHEPCSATTAAQLDQLGDCHEGPTTRSNTVKSGRRSIDREGAR